jgi:5,10-methenyltetrahydrofolate synthetase
MTQGLSWRTWRKAERERLINNRLAMSAAARRDAASRVRERLDELLNLPPGSTVSFYWPFKGEINLRGWVISLLERGVRAALPVVTEKKSAMVFRRWDPSTRMKPGIWNIPVPADAPSVRPDVVIAPLVGFDRDGFRLGYGGGYFDRTLATLSNQPIVIGVGYAASELPSILPQPHDIPMHMIVTEKFALTSVAGRVVGAVGFTCGGFS